MICFGDVACQIVGKPVQQLLRTVTSATPLPAEIARVVSWRFTFVVTLTQQSFYRQERTFQVTSVVMAHGEHEPVPPPAHHEAVLPVATVPAGANGHGVLSEGGAGDPVHSTVPVDPPAPVADEVVLTPMSAAKDGHSTPVSANVSSLFTVIVLACLNCRRSYFVDFVLQATPSVVAEMSGEHIQTKYADPLCIFIVVYVSFSSVVYDSWVMLYRDALGSDQRNSARRALTFDDTEDKVCTA